MIHVTVADREIRPRAPECLEGNLRMCTGKVHLHVEHSDREVNLLGKQVNYSAQ